VLRYRGVVDRNTILSIRANFAYCNLPRGGVRAVKNFVLISGSRVSFPSYF